MDPERQVEAGYDKIAEQYLATKDDGDPAVLIALDELARHGPSSGTALDLGCGAGIPVTAWLAERFKVTGVDVSVRQLELARQRIPRSHFVKANMTAVDFPEGTFDVVVALYSIIHVPRSEQQALVSRIHSWLKPGGSFLATWTLDDWEGEDENWEGWGAPMWWSHYDAVTNLAMLSTAGFEIVSAEKRTSGGETWLWVLARA